MTPVIFPNFNSKPKASSSGVYMSAVEVVRLADNALDWCKKMKAKRRQELIDAEKRSIIKKREKSANRFWNRWLGRSDVGKPLPTDKEIWAELDRSGGGDHIRFGAGFCRCVSGARTDPATGGHRARAGLVAGEADAGAGEVVHLRSDERSAGERNERRRSGPEAARGS